MLSVQGFLQFLYTEEFPADNNGSERDIREINVARNALSAFKSFARLFSGR